MKVMIPMKYKIILFSIWFPCSFSFGGMPVTDPTSYTYYIDQINKTTEVINNTSEQIETLGGIRTQVDQMKNAVWGVYNKTMGAIENAERASERLSNQKAPIDETLDIYNTSGAYKKSSPSEYSDNVKKYLDAFFADPRSIKDDINSPTVEELNTLKQNERQAAIRATIINAGQVMTENSKRLENLMELANEIDQTTNIKDSQDLTNRFLYEILQVMNEFLSVYLMATSATSLMNYDGYNEEEAIKLKDDFIKKGGIEKNENDAYNEFVRKASKRRW